MKYRRRVWYVDAWQYDGIFEVDSKGKYHVAKGIPPWVHDAFADGTLHFVAGDLYVKSDEYGERWVMRDEFIVKDEDGAIYNLPPELFTRMYERCGDDESFI